MIVKIITAVLQVDVRNPFNNIVIEAWGVSSGVAIPKNCHSLEKTEIQKDIKMISETGILNIAVWSGHTEEVHKLHGINGKRIFEIELSAKERDIAPPISQTLPFPIDIGYKFGSKIRNSRSPNVFATLKFTNAKLLNILPVTDPEYDQLLYQVKFDGSGSPRVSSVSG